MIALSVILPTHNPNPSRLARTLAGLRAQTVPVEQWELLVVDNASSPALDLDDLPINIPASLRLLTEPIPGLTHARRRGFTEAKGDILILVDDDNVLAPDYLAQALRLMVEHPKVGACGGPCRPEFENSPPAWTNEFFPLLALRDFGKHPIIESLQRADTGTHWLYPAAAPIGAGMAVRRSAISSWLDNSDDNALTDRRGGELASGGDNDIVLHALHAGWSVGYFPELHVTHLIPATRLAPAYLARLNRGIQKSWVQVLARHNACPWSPIPRWSVPLRQARAWFTRRAWSGPAARIRWQGDCGHFQGRAS